MTNIWVSIGDALTINRNIPDIPTFLVLIHCSLRNPLKSGSGSIPPPSTLAGRLRMQ